MIEYEKFKLANGLTVIVHPDHSTPLAAVNILYNVGARDEDPEKTGFAHLFEHLMFGGSVNIPKFDEPLQRVGGENNAFTNNDITNYYITLPAHNLETAFWLESDRMLSLAFSEKSLEVQRNVVIEEFKERYLNEPYGDVWLLLRPLAFKEHPYRWATIGKDITHIENAVLDDVKAFFKKYYTPGNAVLVVAGNVETEQVKALCEKWFANIPAGEAFTRNLPKEPAQTQARRETVYRKVPFDAIYKVYHAPGRSEKEFYGADLITDILSRGNSSRLYNRLVKEDKLFSELHCYVSGEMDPGLIVVEGKLISGINPERADQAIQDELNKLMQEGPDERELTKVKNKVESTLDFTSMSILNKAMRLAFAESLGDTSMVNREAQYYREVSSEQIRSLASHILSPDNCSTLFYLAEKQL